MYLLRVRQYALSWRNFIADLAIEEQREKMIKEHKKNKAPSR